MAPRTIFCNHGASRDRGANVGKVVLGAKGWQPSFDRLFRRFWKERSGPKMRNCLRRSTASADRRWLASGHGWARFIVGFLCLTIVRRRGAVSPESAAAHFHNYFKQGRIAWLTFTHISIHVFQGAASAKSHAPQLPGKRTRPEPAAVDVSHHVSTQDGGRGATTCRCLSTAESSRFCTKWTSRWQPTPRVLTRYCVVQQKPWLVVDAFFEVSEI